MGSTNRLAIIDSLPEGFLDCDARDLHLMLDGPTLIELAGEREPPLFVSVLLHGNEDSGLGAVQRVIGNYQAQRLPRSLMLLVGNIEAARHRLRRLDSQPDYNRIWPGTVDQSDTAEARMMAEARARVLARSAVAAIDLHNNSGRNPHYSVVCKLDPATLGIASLFSNKVICFRGVPGTQTASFAGIIPAVTAECGQPSEAANAEAAARFVAAALNLDDLPDGPSDGSQLDLYHTLGAVRVREDVSFSFGPGKADLRLDPALERHNFRKLNVGAIFGETEHYMPVRMIDEAGRDVADRYFETGDGKLRLCRQAVPAMLTADTRIVRQDCLCYLMEQL